jgi:hypothetical protein
MDIIMAANVHVLIHSVLTEFNLEFFYADTKPRAVGYRPTSADCYPLLGESHLSGVWFMNGMKRDGFTTAPYISYQLARAIRGLDHELPDRFRPSRKLLSYRSREEAIRSTRLFYEGADFQHGVRQSSLSMNLYHSGPRFSAITDVYEKRGVGSFGIHPELLHLYENDDYFKLIAHPRENG